MIARKSTDQLSNLETDDLKKEYERIVGVYSNMVGDLIPEIEKLGDNRLYLYDLTKELFKRGLVTKEDKDKLDKGLDDLKK